MYYIVHSYDHCREFWSFGVSGVTPESQGFSNGIAPGLHIIHHVVDSKTGDRPPMLLTKEELLAMYGQAVRVACFEAVEQKPTSPIISVLLIKKRLNKNPQILDARPRDVIHWLRAFGVPIDAKTKDNGVAISFVLRGQPFNRVISHEPMTVTISTSDGPRVVVVPGVDTDAFADRIIEDDNPPTPEPPRRTLFPKKLPPAVIISTSDLAVALKIAARDRERHTWISLTRTCQTLAATSYPSLAEKSLGHVLRQRGCKLKIIQGYTVIVWDRTVDALLKTVR